MKARIDFHIHSCLSPCGSPEMTPRAIVARAQDVGLDCIALSDHNCTENLPAFDEVCREAGMPRLYGMEVTASEEMHVLCLFDRLQAAMDFGRDIYGALQDDHYDPAGYGDQPIVTVGGNIEGAVGKLLTGPTDISFFDLVPRAREAGALCIPAHIDRDFAAVLLHLGFLPDLAYSAVEVVGAGIPPEAAGRPVVRFSDSHALEQIGSRFTEVEVDGFTVERLQAAFAEQLVQEGRA